MKAIAMTQFMRPHGRPVQVEVDRPDDVADKAALIVAAGYRFECEELSNGLVHLTISTANDDVDGFLSQNGPELLDKIDALIREFEI
jgi:hypothetical protein